MDTPSRLDDAQRTHRSISRELVGTPIEIGEGRARVALTTTSAMAADDRGLLHGGFTFGLVDYAAMLAVNEPNVVLVSSSVRFVAPVLVGDRVEAEAAIDRVEGKRRFVKVIARVVGRTAAHAGGESGGITVVEGELECAVPSRHVLDPR